MNQNCCKFAQVIYGAQRRNITFGVRRSKVKVRQCQNNIWRSGGDIIFNPFGRTGFLVLCCRNTCLFDAVQSWLCRSSMALIPRLSVIHQYMELVSSSVVSLSGAFCTRSLMCHEKCLILENITVSLTSEFQPCCTYCARYFAI